MIDHLVTQIRGFTFTQPSDDLEEISGERAPFRGSYWDQWDLALPIDDIAVDEQDGPTKASDALQEIKEALGPNRPLAVCVFDTETDASPGQAIRIGYAEVRGCSIPDAKNAWLACRKDAAKMRERYDRDLRHGTLQRTLFYDKAHISPAEIATLKAYRGDFNMSHGMRDYRSRAEQGDKEALRVVDTEKFISFLRGEIKHQHLLVGHNLAFDLSGIATNTFQALNDYYGGFRLMLCPCKRDMKAKGLTVPTESACAKHPQFYMKKVGANKFFYRAKGIKGKGQRGLFLDTLTLTKALFPGKPGSLRALRDMLGIDERFEKPDVEHGREITPQYVEYLQNDVLLTFEVYCKLVDEYGKHNLDRKPSAIYSGASLAKAYHRAFGMPSHGEGLRAWSNDTGDEIAAKKIDAYYAGIAFAAFYAGRVNIYRRKEVAEVMATDFTSCYSAVNALLRNQTLMFATRLVRRHCRDEIAQTLRGLTREQLLARETWSNLRGYARIRPNGDWLPHRAKFGHDAANIAFGPFFSDKPHWYALPDIAASVIRTGRVPELLDGFLLEAEGQIKGNAFAIMGDERFMVHPERDDIFATVINLRQIVKAGKKTTKDDAVKAQLDGIDLGLKTIGNTGSYGVFVEVNPIYDGPQEFPTLIFHGADEPSEVQIASPEGPGKYCHPELGALITAGAHLLLSLGELTAKARGIALAYCDTDSLYFERPDEWSRERFQREVHATCDELQGLSPYASGTQLLKIEDKNFHERKAGEYRPLYFYGVSSKRYCVFNKTERRGRIYGARLRFVSAHGLGPYLTFSDYVSLYRMRANDEQRGLDGGYPSTCKVKRWHYDLWRAAIEHVLGISNRDPLAPLHALPAAKQFTAATWRDFDIARRNYWPDCRPMSFFVTMSAPDGVDWKTAVAPSDQRNRASWILAHRTVVYDGALEVVEIDEPFKTLADALDDYFDNPENKMQEPSGVGRMHERTVFSIGQQVIGKETDRLFEEGSDAGYIGDGEAEPVVFCEGESEGEVRDEELNAGEIWVDISRMIETMQMIIPRDRAFLAECAVKANDALTAMRHDYVLMDTAVQRERVETVRDQLHFAMGQIQRYVEISMSEAMVCFDTPVEWVPDDVVANIECGNTQLPDDMILKEGRLYEREWRVKEYVVIAEGKDGRMHAYDTQRKAILSDEEKVAKRKVDLERKKFAPALRGLVEKYGIKWLADVLSVSEVSVGNWLDGGYPRNIRMANDVRALWESEKRNGKIWDDALRSIRARHAKDEAEMVAKRKRQAEKAKREWRAKQVNAGKG